MVATRYKNTFTLYPYERVAAQPMVDKGVVWNVGRVFHEDGQLF